VCISNVWALRRVQLDQRICCPREDTPRRQSLSTGAGIANLDVYYEDCVVGGPGSFVIAIKEREQFKEATRTKLVQEIASIKTKPRMLAVQAKAAAILLLRLDRLRKVG
jgi:hypothetical protein